MSQTRDSVVSYYHTDGLGSTRTLTNSAQTVTDTYTYDAFGLLLAQTGTTDNSYLYRGEQFDQELGFYYLRARYMNPALGRFVTMDTFAGSNTDPISLHKYLYANANPITYSDPSGYSSSGGGGLMETLMGQLIHGILARMPVYTFNAVRNTIYGTLVGALYSGVDAKLGGEDVLNAMGEGAVRGAKYGCLATIQVLRPVIIGLGLKSSYDGVWDALRQGKYAQAVFRATMLFQQIKSLTGRTFWDEDETPRSITDTPTVEAWFEHQGETFYDVNPTARNPVYRTNEPTGIGGSINDNTKTMHAEVGAMYQSYVTGNQGGTGVLVIERLEACRNCRGAVKKMAIQLNLDVLEVFDKKGHYIFRKETGDFRPVDKGGKRWTEQIKK